MFYLLNLKKYCIFRAKNMSLWPYLIIFIYYILLFVPFFLLLYMDYYIPLDCIIGGCEINNNTFCKIEDY